MGATEWVLLLTLAAIWGGSFFFGKVALRELPPLTLVLARVGIAALALNLVVRATGYTMPRDGGRWAQLFLMGALNNVIPFALISWGQTEIASGLASILNATTPLFTAVLAHWLTGDERLTRNRALGVAAGFLGVAAMLGPDAVSGLGLDLLAEGAVLGAAISYAFAGIFGRRFKDLPPIVTATGQLTASTALMAPVALLADRIWTIPLPSATVLGAVVGLALLSTSLAYILYFRILATAGATNLLLVTFLIPVSALLLGIAVLGEHLALRHLLGMALIALGLGAIDGRVLARLRAAALALRGK